MSKKDLAVKGLLIHVSHYDPKWCREKAEEKPFNVDVAVELVEAMAEAGMNLLIVDCADGVRYRSHPELRRHYSVPMSDLRRLATAAHKHGIDVVPKLNFARSSWHEHDYWMKPHSDPWRYARNPGKYWKVAAELIAELVGVTRPRRFFHVGMDEDHHRSVAQYADAVRTLRKIVGKHGLRTVIWNDSCHFRKTSGVQVHADKCRAAEDHLPRDIVQVLWDYSRAHPSIVKRVASKGFEVWAAPGGNLRQLEAWRRTPCKGVLLTAWVKCDKANRKRLLEMVRTLGAVL